MFLRQLLQMVQFNFKDRRYKSLAYNKAARTKHTGQMGNFHWPYLAMVKDFDEFLKSDFRFIFFDEISYAHVVSCA